MKAGIIFLPHGNLQYSQLPPDKRSWVARESYKTIFDISERLEFKLAFEASGETLEVLACKTPEVLDKLIGGIKEGRIELYSKTLDPLCNAVLDGMTDARWPPAPTSPGRFNVEEALLSLDQANESVYKIMQKYKIENLKSIYSPVLIKTRISSDRMEFMSMKYFGEEGTNG